MSDEAIRMWAYKSDGSACVFTLFPGDELPPGWSHDQSIINDPAHLKAEHLSKSAGRSIYEAVYVGDRRLQETNEFTGDSAPLQYDEDNLQVIPIKRARGWPLGKKRKPAING